MGNRSRRHRRLLAAVTLTGTSLWLTTAALSAVPGTAEVRDLSPAKRGNSLSSEPNKPLSQRVEELRTKLRDAASPAGTKAKEPLRNIVQFFNFLNCVRDPKTKKCRK